MLAEADLIILIGMRAGELESWFEAPDWPRDERELERVARERHYVLGD
jgi:hypothetical protein